MVSAGPDAAAAALNRKAYYYVPLTVHPDDAQVIADPYHASLIDNAVCQTTACAPYSRIDHSLSTTWYR